MSRLRRPGGRWRLLVHEWAGRTPGIREGKNGPAHNIASDATFGGKVRDGKHYKNHLFENTEFDELVVGRWLHVEQMDTRVWWMNIGGVVVVHATIDRDGRPKRVHVAGPGDYDDPVPGCTYQLDWSHGHPSADAPREEAPVPPPPGSTRDQLPAHILALLTPGIYLSTACETARRCDGAAITHPDRAGELAQWRDRLHDRCRLNHKFTGRLCFCRCHQTPPDDTPEG